MLYYYFITIYVLVQFPMTHYILCLGSSLNGRSIKPHERLLCFLWTSGGNATFMSQEWSHNMSYGSIVESNSITREILYEYMVQSKRYLHLPTRQQSLHEAELFARKYGPRRNQKVAIHPVYNFPQILVFIIDGTHIEGRCIALIYLRAQSFTSLKADLRQDINGFFVLMDHFLEALVS